MKARLTGTAYADRERASEWYENKKPGPGLEFADRVLEAIVKIELNPFGYEKVIGDARKAELVQFPYSLRFKIQDDAMIIGCLHGAEIESWQGSVLSMCLKSEVLKPNDQDLI